MIKVFKLIILLCIAISGYSQCLPDYEYQDSLSSACLPCEYNCLTCYNATYCLECMPEYYLNEYETCSKCLYGCSVCSDNSSCSTCNDGLYLTNTGMCAFCSSGVATCTIAVIQTCESNYFLLSTICAGCFTSCQSCSDFVTCNVCNLGFYLSADTTSCLSCSSNCMICSDLNSCTACLEGYTQSGGSCQLFSCTNFDRFCTSCSSSQCLTCQQGKYISNGACYQGASLLCLQSNGPYYINCQTSDYGCASYAKVQTDDSGNQLPVCLPLSASKLEQFIFIPYDEYACASSSCNLPSTFSIKYQTSQAYYLIKYYLNIRFYSELTSHSLIIMLTNQNNTSIANKSLVVDISQQLTAFSDVDPACNDCRFGQKIIKGSFVFSGGQYQTNVSIVDNNGLIQVVEALFEHSICQVQNCNNCTSAVDCYGCFFPYYLQLTTCVLSCDAGFYLYGRICYLQCPSLTYTVSSTYTCESCISPCLTCSNSVNCLSCINGYFLEGNSCLLACSNPSLFPNSTSHQCQLCPNPCITCQLLSNNTVGCLSCALGYLYNGNSCTFICPWGQFGNFVNGTSQCSACSQSCTQCYISSEICRSCSSGFLLLSTSCNALSQCPSSYYINSIYNQCISCQYPCATCQVNATFCTSCIKGSLLNNKCLNQCPSTYYSNYVDALNITCTSCASPCLNCISLTECVYCAPGYYLYKSGCYSTCPISYYSSSINLSCQLCVPPCSSCLNASACLSCTTGFLDNITCTLQCNLTAFISANFQCTNCPEPCISCYSNVYCLQCNLPYLIYAHSCITEAVCLNSTGFYPKYLPNVSLPLSAVCSACSYPCLNCLNNSVTCLDCQSDYLFVPNLYKCVTSCSTSYFQSSIQCFTCSSNCYQCSMNENNCTACSAGLYLYKVASSCVSICPDTYYGDDSTQICLSCTLPCKTCYNAYLCQSCVTGFLNSKQCVSTCPSSTYQNSILNSCVSCTNNCLTCSNSSSNCLTCSTGFFLLNATCSTTCPSLYYSNQYTRLCQICTSPCANCSGPSTCISCQANYYLFNYQCVLSCAQSYYASNMTQQCISCNLTICLTCNNSENNCISCNSNNGYYLSLGLCTINCPDATYGNSITGTCDSCPFPCSGCLNYTYCSTCLDSYYIYLNRCFSKCPINFYPDSNSKCQPCGINCQTCQSPSLCIQCVTGYLILNNNCVTSCPLGYYTGIQAITNYDNCLSCQSNCINCSSLDFCLECLSSLIEFNGMCLSQCPIFYYAVNILGSHCDKCSNYCTSCINATYCLNCIGTFLYNQSCITECPIQTYPYQGESCLPCLSPCFSCTGNFTCLTCQAGYIYFYHYCVTQCPSDVWYYPNNNSCNANCPYNKYSAEMICYVGNCGLSMVSLNGYCLQQCSSGYYVNIYQECVPCQESPSICSNLFVGQLQILYIDMLTLSFYYNQKSSLVSIDDISIQFRDIEGNIFAKNYSSYAINEYKVQIQYDYSSVSLVNITLTIPYVSSQQTSQCISKNTYEVQLQEYSDFSAHLAPSWIKFISLASISILFILIVINICNKASHFNQILDYAQIIGVTLYLDIQYPPILEQFLTGFRLSLFAVTKDLVDLTPYRFSAPKFIYYHIDSSVFRNQIILLAIFFVLFIIFIAIISINTWREDLCKTAIRHVRYRLINDLLSICITPLFLFSLQIKGSKTIDIVITIVLSIIGVGYVGWISYKIVQVKKLKELDGLLGDFQKTSSKVGLMYTPFAFLRRIILTLGLGIAPFSPISTLTLLLVLTFLIMICIYFYEPFDNKYTDYVTIFMECSLTLYILCLVMIALEVMSVQSCNNLGIFIVALIAVTYITCLIWLGYLTYLDVKSKGCCPETKEHVIDPNEKDDFSDSKSQKHRDRQAKQKQQQKNGKTTKPMNDRQQRQDRNLSHEEKHQQPTANQLLNRYHDRADELFSKGDNNEEFKHWSDESSEKQPDKRQRASAEFPKLLIKNQIKNTSIN